MTKFSFHVFTDPVDNRRLRPYIPDPEEPKDQEAQKIKKLQKERKAIDQLVKLIKEGRSRNDKSKESPISKPKNKNQRRSQQVAKKQNDEITIVPEPELVLDAATETVFEIQEVTPKNFKKAIVELHENQNNATAQDSQANEEAQCSKTPPRCPDTVSEPDDNDLDEVYEIIEDDDDEDTEPKCSSDQATENDMVKTTARVSEKTDDSLHDSILEENNHGLSTDDMDIEMDDSPIISNLVDKTSQSGCSSKSRVPSISLRPSQSSLRSRSAGNFSRRASLVISDQDHNRISNIQKNTSSKPLPMINLDHNKRNTLFEPGPSDKTKATETPMTKNWIFIKPATNNKRKLSTTTEQNIPAKIKRSYTLPNEEDPKEGNSASSENAKDRHELVTDAPSGIDRLNTQQLNRSQDELNAVDFLDALNMMYDYNFSDSAADDEDEDFLIHGTSDRMTKKIGSPKAGTSKETDQQKPEKNTIETEKSETFDRMTGKTGTSKETEEQKQGKNTVETRKSETYDRKIGSPKAGTSKEIEEHKPEKNTVETRKSETELLRRIVDSPTVEVKIGGITIKRVKRKM